MLPTVPSPKTQGQGFVPARVVGWESHKKAPPLGVHRDLRVAIALSCGIHLARPDEAGTPPRLAGSQRSRVERCLTRCFGRTVRPNLRSTQKNTRISRLFGERPLES